MMMMIFNRLRLLLIIIPVIFSLSISFEYPYQIQQGTPVSLQNFINPSAGCYWTGVAGQVFDKYHAPADDVAIEIHGILGGNNLDLSVISGTALQVGPGGYELELAGYLVASSGTIYLQVMDLVGTPLSDRIYIDTFDDCERNLVLVNFIEFDPVSKLFLPILID